MDRNGVKGLAREVSSVGAASGAIYLGLVEPVTLVWATLAIWLVLVSIYALSKES